MPNKRKISSSKPKYLFIGGTYCGFVLLKSAIAKNTPPTKAIILKEDKNESKKFSLNISKLLTKHKIPFKLKKSLGPDDYNDLKKSGYDFVLVYGWRSLIKADFESKDMPLTVAMHNSLLPKYRGFAPLQWAIINGEKESGVTLFRVNSGETDSGDILLQKKIKIGTEDYAENVNIRFIHAAVDMFNKFVDSFLNDKIKYRIQIECNATYACKRIPADGKINWEKTSREIFNMVRALSDSSHRAYCTFKGVQYGIVEAKPGRYNKVNFTGRIPGRVYKVYKDGIEVLCGEGTLFIGKWVKGKKGKEISPSESVKSIKFTLT